MQYAEGRPGRVFVVRIDHGEDVMETIRRFAGMKGISSAVVHLLGALSGGLMVTGPEQPVLPPKPHFLSFTGGWDALGTGTVYPGPDGPAFHLHISVGHRDAARTGCLRDIAAAYIVVEAVIIEIEGLMAHRSYDPTTGQMLPSLGQKDM